MRNYIFFLNLPENTCIINYLVTNHLLSPSPKQKFCVIISKCNVTTETIAVWLSTELHLIDVLVSLIFSEEKCGILALIVGGGHGRIE